MAHIDSLPFQEGRPLQKTTPGGTILVDYSSDSPSTHRQVFMASEAVSSRYRDERVEQISGDELSADAPNETPEECEARQLRNRKRATRMRRANERRMQAQRNLDAEFAAAHDVGFSSPIANIAGITAVLAGHADPAVQTAFRMAQRAFLQMNQQNPLPSVQQPPEGRGDTEASKTSGGHPRPRVAASQQPRRDNQGNAPQGSRARGPGGDPQPQAPPAPAPRPEGSVANYRREELELLPTDDLRHRLKQGLDARSIIENRQKEQVEGGDSGRRDDNDRFPAFTSRFDNYKYPDGFKPIGITKYDGKQSPQQWIRCYSTAIESQEAPAPRRSSTSRWPWRPLH